MEDWDADSSRCNFVTTHVPEQRSSFVSLQRRDHPFDSLHSEFHLPVALRPMKRRTLCNARKVFLPGK